MVANNKTGNQAAHSANEQNYNNEQQRVTACLDGSSHSQAVCDYAIWVAKRLSTPLKFLHVIEHHQTASVADLSGAIGLGASEDLLNDLIEAEASHRHLRVKKGNLMLNAAKEKAEKQGVKIVKTSQQHALLNEALIDDERLTRVLIMGLKGLDHEQDGKEKNAIGAQLESVIRSLHKPILIVNDDFKEPKNILLAYNGSEQAKKALEMITSSAFFTDTICHVVHVDKDNHNEENDQFLTEAKNLFAQSSLELRYEHIRSTETDEALVKYQNQHAIDLMVMGAFSHSWVRTFLLGSFTVNMLQRTQTPVLLLR